MKLDFSDIIDKHKNQPGIVIGHGPPLNDYRDRLQTLKDSGYILMGLSNWFEFYDAIPHYWSIANHQYSFTEKFIYTKVNHYKIPVLYPESEQQASRAWIKQNIVADILPYDRANFNNMPAGLDDKFGKSYLFNRVTLQEEWSEYTTSNHYGYGTNAAIFALTLIMLLGCNPIYLVGIELGYKNGYARQLDNEGAFTRETPRSQVDYLQDIMSDDLKHVVDDFEIINTGAKKINVEIINCNQNPLFNIFKVGTIA